MDTKIVTLTTEQADLLFVPHGDEGNDVRATADAEELTRSIVRAAQGARPVEDIHWHLPDVFNIRYGSCYVGTATINGMAVRFVTDLGDWKEGDDK
jgi:hypothetical protein